MKANLELAQEVRMREYFAWIIQLHRRALDRSDGGAINEELEKTFRHETAAAFGRLTTDDQDRPYTEVFELFRSFLRDSTVRATLEERLDLARVRALVQ
jgi:hypothetical protein